MLLRETEEWRTGLPEWSIDKNRYRICQSINRDTSLSDLIDIDSIDQSAEIDDTLVSFIDLSWFLPISSIHIGKNICPSVNQKSKTGFMQTVNFVVDNCCLSYNKNYKEIFKKSSLFIKTTFKIFFWWLILARFEGAQFCRIWIYHPFKITSV